MRQQLREACELKLPKVTPYPEFIERMVAKGELDLSHPNRAMTRQYLASYQAGAPVPPMEYFMKVNEQGCSCFAKVEMEEESRGAGGGASSSCSANAKDGCN